MREEAERSAGSEGGKQEETEIEKKRQVYVTATADATPPTAAGANGQRQGRMGSMKQTEGV